MSDLNDILGENSLDYKKIIVRIKNEEELQELSKKLDINLYKDILSITLPDKKVKSKKLNSSNSNKQKEWKNYWVGMPEFIQDEVESYAKIDFYIREDYLKYFCKKLNITINEDTNTVLSIWYNKDKDDILFKTNYKVLGGVEKGKYPIYIISKGRWEYSATSKHLSAMQVPHYVVVEPQEVEKYENTIGKSKYTTILELDMSFKDCYDSCDEEGDSKGVGKGSGPARNFCWEHSITNGHKWHWLMDDNIDGFHRLHQNHKIKSGTGAIFKATEDFVERFDNIAISGFNYSKFAVQASELPPFVFNTRIFSCILIRNDLPIRWRARYNEDVDLNLRAMKMGYATCQMNAFLADKATTQTVKGGNTDEFYKSEGTLIKSKVLEKLHPDVVTVTWKFSRWHHYADYTPFKNNRLSLNYSNKELIENLSKLEKVNNYGTYIIELREEDIKNKFLSRDLLENKYNKDQEIKNLESKYYSSDHKDNNKEDIGLF